MRAIARTGDWMCARYSASSRGSHSIGVTSTPITFTQLVERVDARLRDFDGSVAWYTITCARELEVRGQLLRHARPVRYSRPPRTRAR